MRYTYLLSLSLLLTGCADVQVGRPESLWLLWLVPALLAFFVYVFRTKARLLRQFVDGEMVARLTRGISRPRQVFKAVLILAAAAAAILGLAEIRFGFTWEEVKRQGVDIVVTLDVSDSMLVEDAESGGRLSRLERAKREIADLLLLLEGDRIGLVAFAGTAFIECPLTLDYGAAELFLDAIDTDLIPVKGTDLAAAIRTSLEAFEGGANNSRAIILITDGEDHSGQSLVAAEEARTAGVRIFTIGIGRDEGAPIPDRGGGFRRDRQGEMVLSRLDEPTLQKIALETGGRYVRSVTGDVDLEQIYAQGIKATLEDQELGSKRRQRWEERFQWFVAAALIVLMLEPLISIRGRRSGTGSHVASALLLLTVLGASTSTAQSGPNDGPAELERIDDPFVAYERGLYDQALQGFTDIQVERPEDPEVTFDVGAAHYQMRNYPEADRAFSRAALAEDASLRQEALYNLGNSAFRQGRLEEAVELYRAALELDPDDEDAKFNLEFVRDEIRRRHEEAQKRQEQQEQQQQQQEEQPQQQPQQDQEQQQSQQEQPQEQEQPQQQQEEQPQGQEQPRAEESGQQDQEGASGGPDQDQAGLAEEAATEPAAGEGLTPEEAERYLQALEEGRPERRLPAAAQRSRNEKDW